MSYNPLTVTSNTEFEKIWKLIFEKRISGIPVVDKKNILLGIIAEEDLITKLYPSYEQYFFDRQYSRNFEEMEKNIIKASKLVAKDIMNKKVYTTKEDAPIMKAASSMLIYKVNCLPVVKVKNEKNMLIGIICKGDIFSQLFKINIKQIKKTKKAKK